MTTSQPHDTRLRRRRNPPGHHAREHPRSNYEQPLHAVTLDLRERALTTKHGPAVPTREYESDRASRTRQARRPLSRAPQTRGSPKPQPSRLTTVPPYELALRRADLTLSIVHRSHVWGPSAGQSKYRGRNKAGATAHAFERPASRQDRGHGAIAAGGDLLRHADPGAACALP